MPGTRTRVFLIAMAMLAVWNAMLVAGFLIWLNTLSRTMSADGSCDGIGCYLSDHDAALILAFFIGLPALVLSGLASLIILGSLAATGMRSGFLAGLAAIVGGPLVAGIGYSLYRAIT